MWPIANLIAFEQALLGALGARDGQGWAGIPPEPPMKLAQRLKTLEFDYRSNMNS